MPSLHRKDLVEPSTGDRFFDLGQNRGAPFDQIARPLPHLRDAAQRQRQPVHTQVADKFQIARSLSDSAASGSSTSGTFTPLRLEITPPITTSQSAKSGRSRHLQADFTVIDQQDCAGFQRLKNLGMGQTNAAGVPSASSRSRRKAAPTIQLLAVAAKTHQRAAWDPEGRPKCRWCCQDPASTWRMIACFSDFVMVPWDMFRRNTSAPASCKRGSSRSVRGRPQSRHDFYIAQSSHRSGPLKMLSYVTAISCRPYRAIPFREQLA